MISLIALFIFLTLVSGMVSVAFAAEWGSDSAKLQHYVEESDRIITGMVIDKEVYNGYEDVWIHVYESLKDNGDPNLSQAIVRVEFSLTGEKEVELDVGDEVLLMIEELDITRGYFGLYHPTSENPPKYPVTLKKEVLALLGPSREVETVEQENCAVMNLNGDEFVYCTYEDEGSRFYVPISITLEKVKQEMLKHVSKEYYDEHFDVRRAWDVAIVDGGSTPHGQEIEFEYKLADYRFVYGASVSIDGENLYLRYAPPREISDVATNESGLDSLVYTCLDEGTYYVTPDRVAINHTDRGFSPYILGQGPPEVRDRNGETIRGAEKRFIVWPETGEIQCFGTDQEFDVPINSEEVFLFDATEYLEDRLQSEGNQGGIWMTSVVIIIGTVVAVSATVIWYLRKNVKRHE